MTALYGIDVAKYQSGLDLAQVKREGFSWVEARCSTGYRNEPIDPAFAGFMAQAKKINLPLVAYHFLYGSHVVPIATQAADCARAIGDTSVPVMIDHETADNTGTPSIADAVAFERAMRAKGYHVPLWYLPHWVWQGMRSPALPTDTGMGLVASQYVNGSGYASALYPGRSSWPKAYGGLSPVIWQFTDKALVAGKHLDADVFEGTPAELQLLLNPPKPKPKPGPSPVPVFSPGMRPNMIVVRIDQSTVPHGVEAPRFWFTWDGQRLVHIVSGVGATNNGLSLLAALGQKEPAMITYSQYLEWGGK